MTKSRNEIQKKSDAKRGVKSKTYKLPESVIADIAELAKQHDTTQVALIADMVELYKQQKSPN